ncbi:cilia- and flagella-associated protein 91-like [Tachypleus tridentatus]|uniref:cilia- and flagella-associated protein 91-like n=1 Tax=Tachypleus tridentatus TaxID=6853 RepID=UPI003FD65C14
MLSELEGKTVGSLLHFISKGLIWLQDERKIQAAVILAEREPRMREDREAGQRQVVEWRRQQEDEIFKQVVKVNEDTYLENIIMDSAIATAENKAQKEVQHLVEKLSQMISEEMYSYIKRKEMVAELVHCFLIPEVNKKAIRKRSDFQQERYRHVVQNILYNTTDHLVNETKLIDTIQNTEKIYCILKCFKPVNLSSVNVSHKNVLDPVIQGKSTDELSTAAKQRDHEQDKNTTKLNNSAEKHYENTYFNDSPVHIQNVNSINSLTKLVKAKNVTKQLTDQDKDENVIKQLLDHEREDIMEQQCDLQCDENIVEQLADSGQDENTIIQLADSGQD